MTPTFDVVIPSAGRPELEPLLVALACGTGPQPASVVVVDDRPGPADGKPLAPLVRASIEAQLDGRLRVLRPEASGRGRAAARNAGWRAGSAEWVCFLDDHVFPEATWRARLA